MECTRSPRRSSQLQYVEFSVAAGRSQLDVWSQDGQLVGVTVAAAQRWLQAVLTTSTRPLAPASQVFVEASFYYRLREDRIHDLFYTFGTSYHSVIQGMAAETIRDVATAYDTIDFFTNRSVIDDAMTTTLSTRLYLEGFANVTQFNLLGIDVPDGFEVAVADKVITGQDVRTLETLRASQLTRTEIAVVDATASGNITVLNADAMGRGSIITAQASAAQLQRYMGTRGASMGGAVLCERADACGCAATSDGGTPAQPRAAVSRRCRAAWCGHALVPTCAPARPPIRSERADAVGARPQFHHYKPSDAVLVHR